MNIILPLTLILACFLPTFVCGQERGKSDTESEVEGVRISGKDNANLRPLDELMTGFLREHSVPGASLAVSRNGLLVYARGFGHQNVEQSQPVVPSTRFRIASISKPITAAAIVSLAHEGKLDFDDKLVSFMTQAERSAVHPQLQAVTIRHLLHHRGGWDRNASFDPMFRTIPIGKELGIRGPANQQQIIQYMLKRPLDFEPGNKYAYSNFGYCLLGRVIEFVTKQPYEEYVQSKVFEPLGIQSFALGHSLTTAKDETRYYTATPNIVSGVAPGVVGEKVPMQYGGFCIENMDSHGGWIASASDLVRLADAFNAPAKVDYLSEEMLAHVFGSLPQDREKDVFYGFGWSVRRLRNSKKINTWHSGSLTGTSTILVRRHDGLNWAVLFNSRDSKNGKAPASLIDPLVHRAVDRITDWPDQAIPTD